MQILDDVPFEDQLAIYAEVQRAADEWGVSQGIAFYLLMQRYKRACAIAAIEEISIEEAASKKA